MVDLVPKPPMVENFDDEEAARRRLETLEEDREFLQQWVTVKSSGPPPRVRSLHVGIVLNDGLYIFGGYDGSNRVNDFHKFDFKRSKWSQINTANTPS